MAFWTPRRRLAGLLFAAAVIGTGCNPLLLPFFLCPSLTPKQEPKLGNLKAPPNKEEAVVLIITSAPTETGVDFAKIDRDLSSAVGRHLKKACEENKEKIRIVPSKNVERFKDDHPDWIALDKATLGRRFSADYVICFEIESISLYEPGSNNLMLHGQVNIDISLLNMQNPEDEPVRTQFVSEYPTKARGPIQADDRNLQEFRESFLESIAKQLAWHFTAHQMRDEDL
jgi:hypothetical protein